MGKGFCFKCNCGYERELYLGVGFCYPEDYEDTIEAAKSGALGAEYKQLMKKHPDAAIDSSIVLMRCPGCNWMDSGKRLSLHLPKPGYDRSKKPKICWSSFKAYYDIDYVSPGDIRENYSLLQEYPHLCHKCGDSLELIEEYRIGQMKLKCPNCGGRIDASHNMMWD